jgi:chromosome segregation ATPase
VFKFKLHICLSGSRTAETAYQLHWDNGRLEDDTGLNIIEKKMENSESEPSEQSDLVNVQEMPTLSTELSLEWTDDDEADEGSDSDDSEEEALKLQLSQVEDLVKKFQAEIDKRKQEAEAETKKSQMDKLELEKLTGELLELRLQNAKHIAQMKATIREGNNELDRLEEQLKDQYDEFLRDPDAFIARTGIQTRSDVEELFNRKPAPKLEVPNEGKNFNFVSKGSGSPDDPKDAAHAAKEQSDAVEAVNSLGEERYVALAFIKENGTETKIAGSGPSAVEASDDLLERLEQYLVKE